MRLEDLAVEDGIVGGPFGSTLVGADYVNAGVPVVRGSNMRGRFVSGEFVYVTLRKFDRDLSRNTAEPGDLVFTQRGTLGQVALVPDSPYGIYVVSQSQMRVRVDASKVEPLYVYYACMAPSFLRQIDDMAIRTGVPHINLGILGKLQIPDMPRREQQAIAEVLGALDDKIAANGRLILLVEERLRALFERDIRRGEPRLLSEFILLNPRREPPSDPAPHIPMQMLPSPGVAILEFGVASPNGGVRFMNGDTLLARITLAWKTARLAMCFACGMVMSVLGLPST
ncbi:restriction endonuclease subunit S [Actinomyces ruminis]|uniref:Restriction endonuclease subunit S n=1 Tax=Actinomyces ruminis TaxID=1937003 RepID=A0ABX4M8N7_9ACTO|nr:restriction endonuclease subunit S [Actinomyces ruminis]PHP51809.1 restriction endonuclease subunit S [Actinomyces ruminis]